MASLIQLQYAMALAREQSFSKAAKSCFVTQPTLSMQIQALESEYDITLFDRSRKPIVPTKQGSQLLRQFQEVLAEFEKIEQVANSLKGQLAGDYRLAVIPTIAPGLLPKLLKMFVKKHPQVLLHVIELTTEEIIEQLIEGKIDGGILSTPLRHPSIVERQLFLEPLWLYHSKDLKIPTATNKRVAIKDLPLDKLLVLTEGNCLRTQVLDLCALNEKSQQFQGFRIEASGLLTLMNLVKEGDCFTILPHMASLSLSKSQRATQLKAFVDPPPVREVGLVTHRAQIKARVDEALANCIATIIPPAQLNHAEPLILSPL